MLRNFLTFPKKRLRISPVLINKANFSRESHGIDDNYGSDFRDDIFYDTKPANSSRSVFSLFSEKEDSFEEIPSGGVFRESEDDDIKILVDNFTSPALALAVRDRENTLQHASSLAYKGDLEKLRELLRPYSRSNVEKRRIRNHIIDFTKPITKKELVILQKYLYRLPRNLSSPSPSRASVVIPICNVKGVPSILFERRSSKMRAHKLQVCFPGGMLDEEDTSIIQTSLREMEEELGIDSEHTEVLGILRCNWNEIFNLTGISVTPVVGYINDYDNLKIVANKDEVENYFTVPIIDLMEETNWVTGKFSAPVFNGGPYKIWGLTGYILEKFVQEVVLKCGTH